MIWLPKQRVEGRGCVWERGMAAFGMTKIHEEIIDFIAAGPSSRAVVDFTASPEIRQRVEDLVRKQKRDGLLPEEEEELADFLQLERLMRQAKARARTLVGRE